MRVKEILERPEALEALRNMLNQSEYFLKSVRNLTLGDDPVFTLVEANTLGKLINETYVSKKKIFLHCHIFYSSIEIYSCINFSIATF